MADCPEDVVWSPDKLIESVNHLRQTIQRLLFQFQGTNQPTIQRIVRSYACQAQQLEQVFLDLCVERALDDAEGAQLDGLGDIVGEPRRGRDDTDYRAAIRARIRINKGIANIEDILLVFTQALATSGFILTEPVPAHVTLEVVQALGPTTPSAQLLVELLDDTVGGGISHTLIYGLSPITERFTFASADVPEVDSALGFSDDSQTSGGHYADAEI